MSLRWTLPDVMHSGISQYDQIGRNKSHVEKKSRHTQAQHLTTFQATPVSKLPHFPQVASKLEPRSLEGPQTVRDSQPNHHSHKSRVPFKPLRKISIPVQKRSIHDTVLSRGPSTSFRFLPQTSIKSDNAKQRIGKTAKRNLNGPEDGVEVARAPSGRSKQLTLQRVDPINIKHSNHPLVPQTTPNGLFIRGYSPGQRKHPVPPFYYVPPTFSQPSSSIPATKIPFFMGHHMQPSSKPEMIQSARRSSSAYQQSQYSPCTEWSSLIPLAKDWSEVSLAVYRVGVGMYHSSECALCEGCVSIESCMGIGKCNQNDPYPSILCFYSGLVCDLIEWHFWQGYGVEARRRYYDDDCQQLVSVDHLPFVTLVPIETLMVPPRQIASLCVELATRQFSCHTYDIIKCNCNHFTAEVLRR